MGAYRGLEEALFFALISTNFLQNLSKFCSKESQRSLNDPSQEFRKSVFRSPTRLTAVQKSPKNFQYFLQRLYKVHTEALPGVQKRKRVHGEFCSESCGKFCGESCDGLRGASSVNLAAHPFSKTRLNLQATHKILPRKATTGQNARRCKYSLLGIQ